MTVITSDTTGQITAVHRTMDKTVQQATGTLTVQVSGNTFTLALSAPGVGQLDGKVVQTVQRQVAFNPFKVTDDTTTTAVTKADVAAVIHAYGAMPGWGNYDAKMDFAGHFKIDIADLSTVASNM